MTFHDMSLVIPKRAWRALIGYLLLLLLLLVLAKTIGPESGPIGPPDANSSKALVQPEDAC